MVRRNYAFCPHCGKHLGLSSTAALRAASLLPPVVPDPVVLARLPATWPPDFAMFVHARLVAQRGHYVSLSAVHDAYYRWVVMDHGGSPREVPGVRMLTHYLRQIADVERGPLKEVLVFDYALTSSDSLTAS